MKGIARLRTVMTACGMTLAAFSAAWIWPTLDLWIRPSGCRVSYFNGEDFGERVARRFAPALLLDCGADMPVSGLKTNRWTARFKGSIAVRDSGEYTFITQNNDGIRLWIDGVCLVDNWKTQAGWARSRRKVDVNLRPGRHSVQVDYYCASSNASFLVRWCGPGIESPTVIDRRWLRKR